jgi:hypothetical protein
MAAYDADAEATGMYMVAFVEAAGEVSPIFERKARQKFETHLGELNAEGWYPMDDVVDAFEDILVSVGPKTMEQGGVVAAETLPLDDGLALRDALAGLNELQTSEQTYRNSDRDAPGGEYLFEVHDDASARLSVSEAWPLTEPYAKGVFKGVVERWGGPDASPNFTDASPRSDESAAWTVEW